MKIIIIISRWLIVLSLFVLVIAFTNNKYQEQLVFLDKIHIEFVGEAFISTKYKIK